MREVELCCLTFGCGHVFHQDLYAPEDLVECPRCRAWFEVLHECLYADGEEGPHDEFCYLYLEKVRAR